METDRICEEDGEKQVEAEKAVKISNYANVLLLVFKIYATAKTGSIAIAATTLDSLLDLTRISMRNVNNYEYPIGKLRTRPVGMIIFAAIMATLGSFVAPCNFFFGPLILLKNQVVSDHCTSYQVIAVHQASLEDLCCLVNQYLSKQDKRVSLDHNNLDIL